MKQPKNWLLGIIISAIIVFFINWALGNIFTSKNEMIYKLDPEILKILEENKKTDIFIVIEGKETKVKPNSDGEIKIKVPEEDDGKTAELKVINEEGRELKNKDITLEKPAPTISGFPTVFNTSDKFKFEFTDIQRHSNNQVEIFFKTTNLDNEDRNLTILAGKSICYTDSGTQHGIRKYCINDRCTRRYGSGKIRSEASNLMPSNIHLNSSLLIQNMDKDATMIKRLIIGYSGGKKFELKDIKLPLAQ